MRINVYSQELTKEVRLVSKADHRGRIFYGVRFYLSGSDLLHHTPDDDDRSAVTFWLPATGSFTPYDVAKLFTDAALAIRAHCEDHGL